MSNNVIPIRPGIQVPNAFSVLRPIAVAPIRLAPAGQAAPAPFNGWKVAAIVLGGVVIYGTGLYYWEKGTAKYRPMPRPRSYR